ncbi:MAG: hypothetical protein O3C40_31640 [Planctomycetota bacterium]|nr:hypothetical protein [Planctomycetota bacterium]
MIARYFSTLVAIFALSLASSPVASAAEQVTVVVGQGATDLEHLAAQELVSQFKRLFDAHVVLTDFVPDKHQNLVLVGGPQKNKATREVVGDSWPKLSEQGFILRSFDTGDRRGAIVAGDSPAATYWAVCELGHHFGIRYLLREDIYPDTQPLKLTGLDVLMEPEVKFRAWKTLGDGVTGPESWSAADQKKLLGQLAKMKFNQIILSVRPWQPFAEYEFRGVSKQSAALWRGEQYPIPRDAPGRTAFGTADSFVNPDFAGKQTHEEMTAAGIKHVRGIISAAKRLGMSVALELSPLEFPREFERAIPGLVAVAGSKELAVHPGPNLKPGDAAVRDLVETQLRAYVETYPNVDTLYCTNTNAGSWQKEVSSIAEQFNKQRGPDSPVLTLRRSGASEGNLGVLSRSTTRRQSKTLDEGLASDVDHLSVQHTMLAELDPTIHYLSRAAWDKSVMARSAHDDFFATITGSQAVADRLWLGFGHIESATQLTTEKDADFSAPSPDMLLKHYRGEPAPEWWTELNEHYTQAMIELYRSHGAADARARPLLFYYAKRSEYVLEYLGAVKAVRAAAIAKQAGDNDAALEQLEAAIESLYNAIDTLGDVAQDPSDRGLIAALNAYAYRPLLAERERLSESE